MWLINQLFPDSPAYNLTVGYRLAGRLDPRILEEGLNAIVQRHEILRTTFAIIDNEPVQVVHPECRINLATTDLEDLPAEERESRLQELASEEATRSFDLSCLPLIRASLFRIGEAEHVFILSLHHFVSDGLSIRVMLGELDAFYGAHASGAEFRPLALSIQYGDFSAWQRGDMAPDTFANRVAYWRQRLIGASHLELVRDLPRPAQQSLRGSNIFFEIPQALTQALGALGAAHGCTFFMTAMAAFQVLLWRYSGSPDITIGTPISARGHPELEPLIGNFLNVAALRCDLSGDPSFAELLGRNREATLEMVSHGDLPFESMVKALKIERDSGRNPVFQVMLQVLPAGPRRIGNLDISSFHFDLKFAQLDLSLHLYEEGGGYCGRFEYCTDLFHAETIHRLSLNFGHLLRAIVGNADQRISAIPCLAEGERKQLALGWNDTRADYPRGLLVTGLFEAQAARGPGRIAILAGREELSYGELEARANRVARTLRARGVGRGQRVGVCVERGADMVAAVLGISKAGAAYVPLDPAFPAERLRFMVEDAQLSLLVANGGLADPFGLQRERLLLLDVDEVVIASQTGERLLPDGERDARPEDPAYVIYTSGSTGKPKGVVVPHRAVVNFLSSMAREPGLGTEDVLVAVTTLSFDIAVLELQLPLTRGATVVVASRDEAMDGQALGALLERHGATVMQATPVTWRLLVSAGWSPKLPFKALVGGEALPRDLAEQLVGCGMELWNMYGPTETTVWSTCARVAEAGGAIAIGRPIANTTVYILDEHGNLCPIGVPGELCIGGEGVTLGYWRRPELTAERFVPDPFSSVPGTRLYKTGDRARWRADGMLEHLGRLDFQVKIRGYRIELGEIEAGLAQHAAVREAVVVVREDVPGDPRLVAYLVAADPPVDLAARLRALLRASLPEYMVPSAFVVLGKLPLTANGKIDRKALPAPEIETARPAHSLTQPETSVERALARIWQDLLQLPVVHREDNFFDLGGHSLLVMKVIFEMERTLGKRVPPNRFIFESLRQIAHAYEEAQIQPPPPTGGLRNLFAGLFGRGRDPGPR